MKVSRTLIERIKLAPVPAYKLALGAGCHPATLSKLLHGAERLKPNDPRILAVGRELRVAPADCFADVSEIQDAVAAESAESADGDGRS